MRAPRPENIEKVIAALTIKPMTIPAIQAVSSVTQPTITRVLEELRKEDQCFILDYEISQSSNARAAIYALGQGVDAERPPRVSKVESNRRYKEKLLSDICTRQEGQITEKLRRELSRPAFRHPFDIWMFGPAKAPSQPTEIPVRTFLQDMTITKDELEEV